MTDSIPTIPCPACHGSGYAPEAPDPQDTKFCAVCKGDAEITQEEFDNIVDGAAEFYDDGKGDWLYDQQKDREALRNG